MGKRLLGKVAVITGGAVGIGKATAVRFLEEGAKVIIADIHEESLQEAVQACRAISPDIIGVTADITKRESVKSIAREAVATFGTVDVLFNNAGLNHAGRLHETSLEDWEKVFSVNVKGMYLMCKEILPIMVSHGKGSVINTASPGALVGLRGLAAYCASKGAVPALTRSIAIDYAPYHIRANFICPGVILTEMTEKIIQNQQNPEEYRDWYRTARPLGRFGEAVEIANAAVFLASDEATFMTGASVVADGGFTEQ